MKAFPFERNETEGNREKKGRSPRVPLFFFNRQEVNARKYIQRPERFTCRRTIGRPFEEIGGWKDFFFKKKKKIKIKKEKKMEREPTRTRAHSHALTRDTYTRAYTHTQA